MATTGINEYVRAQLQRGYPPQAIRTALLQAGYNQQDVDFALRLASKESPHRPFVVSGRNFAIAIGGMLAIILLVFAGIMLFGPSAKEIQLSLSASPREVLPGGTISLSAAFSSEQKRAVEVEAGYVVLDSITKGVVTTRSSRIEVGKSAIDTQQITLPADISPGDYEVRLTAKFERLTKVTTAGFTVMQPVIEQLPVQPEVTPLEPFEEVSPVECPGGCDDLNPATDDACETGQCVHRFKSGVCGNSDCETGENKLLCPQDCGGSAEDKEAVVKQAVSTSKSDPEKAATICTTLIIPNDMDPCFTAIANASRKSALCENIQDMNSRDNCLMEFAFAGDYSVCEKMNNRYFLTSCQSLARFSTFPKTEEEINQQIQQQAAALNQTAE